MFLSDLEDGSSIFIDANIFIYHFSKKSKLNPACSDFLERAELGKINGFTSASVVQEVTHRMMIMEAIALLTGIKARDMVKYLKEGRGQVSTINRTQVSGYAEYLFPFSKFKWGCRNLVLTRGLYRV